jgi:mRNA interferase MazF
MMLNMTSYNFGDVILVPFPFTNQTTSKKRPAVIISSDTYNREHPDLIVMAITSQSRQILMFGDVTITNWQEAGLLKPSIIKAIVTTVEKTLVLRKLGQLQAYDIDVLRESLVRIIG